MEMYSKVWQANVQMKSDIYAAKMVTLKDAGDQDAGPARTRRSLHPMFYHQLPPDLHLEVIHSFSVVGALGLPTGWGTWHKLAWPRESPTLVSA